ncbi:hypothetical protein AMTRI_Chr12g269000 [Amborella trichopoda]
MYTMSYTKPDITFVVGKLSRYTSNPGTIDYGLHYVGEPTVLEGYNDANWITDSKESMSTSGWFFTYGGGAITWGSKKQTCISKSMKESELITLEVASK